MLSSRRVAKQQGFDWEASIRLLHLHRRWQMCSLLFCYTGRCLLTASLAVQQSLHSHRRASGTLGTTAMQAVKRLRTEDVSSRGQPDTATAIRLTPPPFYGHRDIQLGKSVAVQTHRSPMCYCYWHCRVLLHQGLSWTKSEFWNSHMTLIVHQPLRPCHHSTSSKGVACACRRSRRASLLSHKHLASASRAVCRDWQSLQRYLQTYDEQRESVIKRSRGDQPGRSVHTCTWYASTHTEL